MFERNDFLAGALCLDFANTVSGNRAAEHRERLESYSDLLDWAEAGSVLPEAPAGVLRRLAAERPEAAESVVRRARRFREALYAVLRAAMKPCAASEEALRTVNDEVARAMAHVHLKCDSRGYALDWQEAVDLDLPLWPVARNAVELLTSGKLERLTECGGDTCGWLFLDLTKNRSRRWCDMKGCGNRAKVRRYRERSAAIRP